jgi:hypothetical protein
VSNGDTCLEERPDVKAFVFSRDPEEAPKIGPHLMNERSPYVRQKKVSLQGDPFVAISEGVTVEFLCKLFGLSKPTVKRKIGSIAPIRLGSRGQKYYPFRECCERLVTPKERIQDILEVLKPEDMPEKLREAYWSAKLKQQRYEEKAHELWRTERVIEVFSEVLQLMRTKLQLLPEAVEKVTHIDFEETQKVREIVDDIQDSIYQEFMKFAEAGRTPNQLGEDRESEMADLEEDLDEAFHYVEPEITQRGDRIGREVRDLI